MCKICVAWEKKKITSKEAFGSINKAMKANLYPMGHLQELSEKIISAEVPMGEVDAEADALWSDENKK